MKVTLRRRTSAVWTSGLAAIISLLTLSSAGASGSPDGPALRSSPRGVLGTAVPRDHVQALWRSGFPAAPRGASDCTFDNGPPLDDFGDPASQLSISPSGPADPWDFIAAGADDFTIGTVDGTVCRVSLVRAAFHVIDDGSGVPSPSPLNTWESVLVTIYENDPGAPPNEPTGEPDGAGGQIGPFIVSQEVDVSQLLNEVSLGGCRLMFSIDIPVNFLVRKGVKYWLSIVPRHYGATGSTQSFWCISSQGDAASPDGSLFGFEDDPITPSVPFWTALPGNEGICASDPPQGSRKDLSFQIVAATSENDSTGACCDDTTGPGGTCSDSVSIVNCQQPNDRFSEGDTCATLSPPCGTTDLGACCSGEGICIGTVTPLECAQEGGAWYVGDCGTFTCPPTNDACEDQNVITGDVTFDTTTVPPGSGEPLTGCGAMVQDIWFAYSTTCTGDLTISTLGSSFDTVLAVYGPSDDCPVTCPLGSPDGDFSELACNDDIPDSTDSYVVIPVTSGQCFLIRVGGRSGASVTGGQGELRIDCISTGFGACCLGDLTCSVVEEAACTLPGSLYTPGQPCSTAMTCPPPCCVGDLDGNCLVDLADVPLFVDLLLTPPAAGTDTFCRADVNRDIAIDALDIQPFVQRVMQLASCRVSCCPGDSNGDGVLDGLDLQGLVDSILANPPCTTVAFCRADVNEDVTIDLLDADALVDKLLNGDACPIP